MDSRDEICVLDVVDIEEWAECCFDFLLGNSSRSTPIRRLFVTEAEHEVSPTGLQDSGDFAREDGSVIVIEGVE